MGGGYAQLLQMRLSPLRHSLAQPLAPGPWVIILFSLFVLRTFCCCVSRAHPAPLLTCGSRHFGRVIRSFLLDAHFEVFAGSSSDPFAHFAASVGAISARSPLFWCRLPAALPRLRAAWLTLSRARSPLTPALRAARSCLEKTEPGSLKKRACVGQQREVLLFSGDLALSCQSHGKHGTK